MIRLSAFGDEISQNLNEQVEALRRENIGYFDLRSVWDTNVLDLDDAQVGEVKEALDAAGIRMASIGSPVAKVPSDTPLDEVEAGFERAVALARRFETPYIRIFSYSAPKRDRQAPPESYRDEAFERLRLLRDWAGEAGITLVMENDTGLYADTIERSVDLMSHLAAPNFRMVFDPQNFVSAGERPYPDGYDACREWIEYVHVKDRHFGGPNVVAGEGDAGWPEILRRLREDGYDGVLSLEPHLVAGGPYGGFSGPERFHAAAQALKGLLDGMGWDYE